MYQQGLILLLCEKGLQQRAEWEKAERHKAGSMKADSQQVVDLFGRFHGNYSKADAGR